MGNGKNSGNDIDDLGKLITLFSSAAEEIMASKTNINGMRIAIDMVKDYADENTNDALKRTNRMWMKKAIESVSSTLLNKYNSEFDEGAIRLAAPLANMQASIAVLASLSNATAMIKEMQQEMLSINTSNCIETMRKALSSGKIDMPDLYFFKRNDVLNFVDLKEVLPRGLKTTLKSLNVASIDRLVTNDKLYYDTKKKSFISEGTPSEEISVGEMNAICQTASLLETISQGDDFNENDLISFMEILDESPTMAANDATGKRICEVIGNYSRRISFDRDKYYHGKLRNKEEIAYTWDQMRKAPYGVTKSGRFNHPGQAYFYFTDNLMGVKTEIENHINDEEKEKKLLQIAELGIKVNNNPTIVDLSDMGKKTYKTLFKYITSPVGTDKSIRPRAYYITQFISDYCRSNNLDGIKYYGGEYYSNYVTWEDFYFYMIDTIDVSL